MDGRLDPCTPNLPLKRQCNAARPLKSSESTRPLAPTLRSFGQDPGYVNSCCSFSSRSNGGNVVECCRQLSDETEKKLPSVRCHNRSVATLVAWRITPEKSH